MDVNALTNLISTVGYPIVIGFVLMYYIKYQADQHKEEIEKISEALNNNTRATERLITKLEGKEIE